MVIGVCTLELSIPAAASLKDKRGVVKSMAARLRHEFNVAVAEVGHLDSRQAVVVAAVTVSSNRDYVHGLLTRVALWVERARLDCELVDYEIELI
ncbi:MAG: DUF503 domain-containing protein [Anaerolineae bacterium]|nr:DUF503 domain-containing protein [Anaerolineae bacterium]